jgi:hypothetical protein
MSGNVVYSKKSQNYKLSSEFVKKLKASKVFLNIVDYIRVFEIGSENNLIHIHVVLINPFGFINREIIQKCWSYKDWKIGNIDIRYSDDIKSGIDYILKYITKLTKIDRNDPNLKNQLGFKLMALLWSCNKRLYSTSNKFTVLMNQHMLVEELIKKYHINRDRAYRLVFNPDMKKYVKHFDVYKRIIIQLLRSELLVLIHNRLIQKIFEVGFCVECEFVEDYNVVVGWKSGLSPPLNVWSMLFDVDYRWFYVGSFASDLLITSSGVVLEEGVYWCDDYPEIVSRLFGGV